MHALVSDCWVQPSQPTPTPALSSSPSGCLLTHAMPNLSSPHQASCMCPLHSPLLLAMLLLCYTNELLGIGVGNKTHLHRPTYPRSQYLTYQAAQGSFLPRVWLVWPMPAVDPGMVLMDFAPPRGRCRPKQYILKMNVSRRPCTTRVV